LQNKIIQDLIYICTVSLSHHFTFVTHYSTWHISKKMWQTFLHTCGENLEFWRSMAYILDSGIWRIKLQITETRRRPVRCTGLTEHDKHIKHGRDLGRIKALLIEYLIDYYINKVIILKKSSYSKNRFTQ
jgi:hypothetical protein